MDLSRAGSGGLADESDNGAADLFAGPGEVRALARDLDWSTTPLGSPGAWSPALRSAVLWIFDTPVPVCLWAGSDYALVYNDAYRRILSAKHPTALGQPGSVVWAEIWEELKPQFDQVRSGGASLYFEDAPFVMARLEGGGTENAWFSYSLSALRDEGGAVCAVLNISPETTARVLAASALQQAEAAARVDAQRVQLALAAGAIIGTWFWDLPTDRFTVDAAFARAFGLDPALGHHGIPLEQIIATVHPDDRDGLMVAINEAITRGGAYAHQYRVRSDDGQYHWIEANGRVEHAVDGTPLRFPGVLLDMSERKAADLRREALVALADRVRDATDADDLAFAASTILGETLGVSRVGYGAIDHEAETLTVDRDWLAPGVESLAGTLNLRAYGDFIDDLKRGDLIVIPDVEKDVRTAAAATALKARSSGAFVNVPVLERGRLVAVLFLNNAEARDWRPEDLEVVQEVADRLRTATERLHVMEALRISNETLEARVEERTGQLMAAEEALRQSQKMEAVGQLTGGIAHDFNNLLTGISGSLELLDKRIASGRLEGVARYLDTAQDSTRRAAALTQRLLAFARRQTLDPKVVDINRVIVGMADLLNRSVGPAIHMEVVQAVGLWPTRLDAPQLENAILNLCINARDAMAPGGGRITIETANKWLDERAAKERDLQPGQYVSVCVTDTGTGMPPDVIAKVFDPFFTTKPLGQGTGLGLSMIYGFVRQSGGQIRIYSEVGKGTTMCLYLPRYYGEADAEDGPTTYAVDPGAGETVLIIDDEAPIRMLIADVLSEHGYAVLEAADGPAGLQILQGEGRIDLLITDVGLPGGLNGRQVADAARLTRPDLRVLFITGYAENAIIGNGHLDSGMSVITKPFPMDALATKVRELIDD